MTTTETALRARWDALPGSNNFETIFEYPLDEVRAAERSIAQYEAWLALRKIELQAALDALSARVEKVIAREW